MQPDVLDPCESQPRDASHLKAIFREGWSDRARVEGWIAGAINAEYADPACRYAWKEALRRGVGGARHRDALDIGTGPGTIAQLWAEMNCATTGLDFSPAMIDAAGKAAKERGLAIQFIEGDAEDPPIRRKRFDIISSRFVLFTLPHPGYALRRWVEMLRPNGVLVLIGHEQSEPTKNRRAASPAKPRWQASEEYRDALRQLPFTDHTAAHLRVMMEAAGLQAIERVPVDELLATRTALRKRKRAAAGMDTTPYIMVGRKRTTARIPHP